MAVRILYDGDHDMAALYCSTTDVAFGPIFTDEDCHDGEERAEAFLRWLPLDARRYSDFGLLEQYHLWRLQESEQWTREEADGL